MQHISNATPEAIHVKIKTMITVFCRVLLLSLLFARRGGTLNCFRVLAKLHVLQPSTLVQLRYTRPSQSRNHRQTQSRQRQAQHGAL